MGLNSIQICIIHIYIHAEIKIYNEMQKERTFMLSFGGAKDVSMGKSNYFWFWRPGMVLGSLRIDPCYLVLQGKSSGIDPWFYDD